ncbi:Uncharacterised protein [Chromobacterium violaceum]|uniref:Uncharacterized protein n=1 Tax=Chromobacterium violaceum TaxID=536 RepID=A0A3S4HIS8_CHRVL|nr:Uncharacterised protein [Chromobacterium violaceum]
MTKTKYLARVAAYFKGEFARLLAARDAELLGELKEMRSPSVMSRGGLCSTFDMSSFFIFLNVERILVMKTRQAHFAMARM